MINKLLCNYGNPQVCGTGQTLYKDGQQYGIDPAFALAFFWHESNFGTKGEAYYSKSLGNLRCINDRGIMYRRLCMVQSWEDGYTAWYSLISNLYIKQWGLSTIDQIIPKYAPAVTTTTKQAYINNVRALSQLGEPEMLRSMLHKKPQALPKNWKTIATDCKEKANWRCEKCGVKHRTIRISRWTQKEYTVYLQAAHKNHDPDNQTPN